MAHTVSTWETWKPEIDAYIQDEKDLMPASLYEKVFTVAGSDRLQVPEKSYSGYGPLVEVGELGGAVEDDHQDGYKYAYSSRNYRKKAVFSSDMFETDQTSEVERMARDFARVKDYSRNLWTFSVFRNAFNSLYTYGDGKCLVSTAHPIKLGGGTQSNTFSGGTQKPVTYDNALELQDVMLANVSNSGNLLGVAGEGRNKVLFGSWYLREKLKQIAGVQAPSNEPDTADNNVNYFKGDKWDVLILPWLSWEAATQAGETSVAKTSASNVWDTMWGIMDMDLVKRNFKMYYRNGYPKEDSEVIKNNQAMVYYLYDKYAYGLTSFLGVAMSKGDSSTYAG